MFKPAALACVCAFCVLGLPAGFAAPANPFEADTFSTPSTAIDEIVFGRLKQLGIEPARPCSDAVFVRRVYLDLIGTLPTAKEASAFLQSRDATKRSDLINRLMTREEFADYWAMKWSDLLRIKAEFPINLWPNAAQAYHRWVHTALRDNLPYDQFVREMLTANGSNFRVPQVNFYRAMQNREPQGIAQTVALTFMGARAEKWPRERLAGMGAFFGKIGFKPTSEWKEEIIYFDPDSTNAVAVALFPDGSKAQLGPDRDPRIVFADWLVSPANPWFTRNIANRAWWWFMGRGIVHEPDDFRPDNPPANPELLFTLEKTLVSAKYDLRALFRVILNSRTYQLSSIPAGGHPEADANFSHYAARRLDAEVLIDALCEITGTTEKYTSAIPEPFTFMPEGERAMALPDGSITSPFLELFGRPARDTGLELERNNRSTADQRLHLLNSSHIQRKLEQSRNLQNLAKSTGTPRDVISGLYLMMLSRYPTDEEWTAIRAYSQKGGLKQQDTLVDVAWGLLNSTEFLYRH